MPPEVHELLPAYWPHTDQHTIAHVALEAEPPNPDRVMPLLVRLAAQSDALRSVQAANGKFLSWEGASGLRRELSTGLYELSRLVDDVSAEVIRTRADALSSEISDRTATMQIATSGVEPPLEVLCGPLCTWRPKTREPLHSFIAAVHHGPSMDLMNALDDSLEQALDELRHALNAPMSVSCIYPMHMADLILSAGEAAGHPKHFAYFMPEDEGVDGVPKDQQRTLAFRNVHLARFETITEPLARALLDGPLAAAEVPYERTLLTWLRGHDLGHNIVVPETDYSWLEDLGVEPFMALQEALADVYGFLLSVSEPWLRIAGVSRTAMCATHMAELLHYMRRGPWHHGDAGATYLELSFLAENGFVSIDDAGQVSWTEEDLLRGMHELAVTLTRSTLSARSERPSSELLERYGWPAETAAKRTLMALREDLANVPTSVAFHRPRSEPGVCRKCGCTAERACWHQDFGGCGWAEPDLCTACTPDAGPGWEHPQDFGPREDEDGEGVKPADPSDGAESKKPGVVQKTAPDAEDQEGAESSRVGRPSDCAEGPGGHCPHFYEGTKACCFCREVPPPKDLGKA